MTGFLKLFIFLLASLFALLAFFLTAHFSCVDAKNNLDNAKTEFVEYLEQLSHSATKIATLTKIYFPEKKKIVRKVEFVQKKLEQNLSAVEIIKAHEILHKSLKSMMADLNGKASLKNDENFIDVASTFLVVSKNASVASTNFFSKAKLYNKSLDGFFAKVSSPMVNFEPLQLDPPKKKKR